MKYINYIFKTTGMCLGLLCIHACITGDDNSLGIRMGSRSGVPVPPPISAKSLPENGTLSAYVKVDNGSPQAMEITDEQAEATISDLTPGSHEMIIGFEFDSPNFAQLIPLAIANRTLDLIPGGNFVTISSDEYEYPNSDTDLVNNLEEIIRGKNPFDGNDFPWIGSKVVGLESEITSSAGVTIDSDGSVFIGGTTTGSLDGNPPAGPKNLFIAKFDSQGTRLWLRELGVASANTYATDIAVDSSGDAFITGYSTGDLSGEGLTGSSDFFIAKYSSAGTKLWVHQLGVADVDTIGIGVCTDSSGNSFVTGSTQGGLDSKSLTGTTDFFVIKFNSSGIKQWTELLGQALNETIGAGVVADSTGAVYITGKTTGALDGVSPSGLQDFFVTKYDSFGNKQWTILHWVASTYNYATDISVDSGDNIYVTGHTFGNDKTTLIGDSDVFIAKFNSSGTEIWTRKIGAVGAYSYGESITTDGNDNVFATGDTYGDIDGNSRIGTKDVFITKFDSAGEKQWTRQQGVTDKTTSGTGVDTDAEGSIFLTGDTTGNLDGNTLTGAVDFYVIKFNVEGDKE